MVRCIGVASRDCARAGACRIVSAPGRCPCWCSCWRSTATSCTVKPVNLIWSTCGGNTDWFSYPNRATTEGTARVLECRSVVRLHRAVGPAPLALRTEGHVGLDLNPIRPGSEDRCDWQVCREGSAHLYDWNVGRAENLRAGKSRVVGVNEDIPIGSRSEAVEVCPIGVNRLDIPSLTSGHDEVIRQIGTE